MVGYVVLYARRSSVSIAIINPWACASEVYSSWSVCVCVCVCVSVCLSGRDNLKLLRSLTPARYSACRL